MSPTVTNTVPSTRSINHGSMRRSGCTSAASRVDTFARSTWSRYREEYSSASIPGRTCCTSRDVRRRLLSRVRRDSRRMQERRQADDSRPTWAHRGCMTSLIENQTAHESFNQCVAARAVDAVKVYGRGEAEVRALDGVSV